MKHTRPEGGNGSPSSSADAKIAGFKFSLRRGRDKSTKRSDFGGRFLLQNVTGSTRQNQLVVLGVQPPWSCSVCVAHKSDLTRGRNDVYNPDGRQGAHELVDLHFYTI